MYTSALFHRYPAGQPLSLELQVEKGALVCPRTRVRLVLNADKTCLVTSDGKTSYPIENGVPFLVEERSTAAEYAAGSSQMLQEYSEFASPNALARAKMLIIRFFNATWQSKASMAAHERTFAIPEGGLCLSVGGGPTRTHPRAVNLNIGPFPHVDVVADAHRLPYADGSVDSLVCEDVLEHIRDPLRVVQEFHRVLKPGASVYCATPFLISYHGYPFHFQNFTHQGHQELFRLSGFERVEGGVCMGAFTALLNLVGFMLAHFLPKGILRRFVCRSWTFFSGLTKPLDRLFQRTPAAAETAYSTYVLATKAPLKVP
ncbi:MAG: methyltransferase domain-containing protein [Silvanigrellales bacterium]|nr:methyltransferase domain-containing protein [Silvanigrellales bacterium]